MDPLLADDLAVSCVSNTAGAPQLSGNAGLEVQSNRLVCACDRPC